ncbi:MAG: DNA-processing protein DprA [Rikenellaceae bacterium]|nr:DNA-processing protein DprA [Rikenellaceae bacterium]
MIIEDLALQFTPGLGVKGTAHLLELFGTAERIFAASKEELVERAELRPAVADELVRHSGFSAAERELRHCERNRIRILTSTDAEYPSLLREIPDYPHVLFVQGDTEALAERTLAMVGTRTSSPYGQNVCKNLVEELSERIPRLKIISGLAFGIDAAAHRAAIEFGIKTVAVLANPLPEITPIQHTDLAREILRTGGALVSELNSQTKLKGVHYLTRNRLIAGLAAGCIVVESPAGGGSLATADYADAYHRAVMAVPGRISDRNSLGTNHLIRTRKAQLIASAEDIIRELMWDFGEDPTTFRAKPSTPELTRDEEGLLGCFRTSDPLSVENLRELTGLDTGELTALLIGLELSGAVRQLPGNRYMKL